MLFVALPALVAHLEDQGDFFAFLQPIHQLVRRFPVHVAQGIVAQAHRLAVEHPVGVALIQATGGAQFQVEHLALAHHVPAGAVGKLEPHGVVGVRGAGRFFLRRGGGQHVHRRHQHVAVGLILDSDLDRQRRLPKFFKLLVGGVPGEFAVGRGAHALRQGVRTGRHGKAGRQGQRVAVGGLLLHEEGRQIGGGGKPRLVVND